MFDAVQVTISPCTCLPLGSRVTRTIQKTHSSCGPTGNHSCTPFLQSLTVPSFSPLQQSLAESLTVPYSSSLYSLQSLLQASPQVHPQVHQCMLLKLLHLLTVHAEGDANVISSLLSLLPLGLQKIAAPQVATTSSLLFSCLPRISWQEIDSCGISTEHHQQGC